MTAEVTGILSSSNDDTKRRRRRITLGLLGLILVAVIVAIIVYFTTRPKNLEVTQTKAEESLPSLIKAAMIGNGALLIEYTELLEDKSTLFYYATLQDLDFTTLSPNNNDDNLVLYLTHTSEPTLDELSFDSEESVLRIGEVDSMTFSFRLPDSFLPGDYNGVLLIGEKEEEGNNDIRLEGLVGTSFKIVDPEQNIATPTETPTFLLTPSPSKNPTTSPTNFPTRTPTISPQPSETDATRMPTSAPVTPNPTTKPTSSPTRSPRTMAPVPTSPPLPPNLVSNLESQQYNVDGTITMDYVMRFQNSEIVTVPRLRFNIPEVIRAPGPFLYLSKRPFSETSRRGSELNEEDDIAILIDEVSGGGFTVEGMFDQILDEIDNIQDLNEYINGSWIVW